MSLVAADPGPFPALSVQDLRVPCVGVEPAQVGPRPAGLHRVVRLVGAGQGGLPKQAEMRPGRVGPGRVGRREAQLHGMALRPAADALDGVGREVVQDDEDPCPPSHEARARLHDFPVFLSRMIHPVHRCEHQTDERAVADNHHLLSCMDRGQLGQRRVGAAQHHRRGALPGFHQLGLGPLVETGNFCALCRPIVALHQYGPEPSIDLYFQASLGMKNFGKKSLA